MIEIVDFDEGQLFRDIKPDEEKYTIFHHKEWLSVLQKQYRCKPFYISNNNSNKALLPICEVKILGKKKWVSLPFSDYVPSVFESESELLKSLDYLIEKANLNGVKFIELKFDTLSHNKFSKKQVAYSHITQLTNDTETLFKSFKKTRVQQPITKSHREGINVTITNNYKDMEIFYKLHLMTRKKLGVPIQPKNFFKLVYEKLIRSDLGFISIAEKDNIPLSAGIFAGFGKTLTYKYGASNPEYLKLRANHSMIWEAMKEAVNRDYKYFDFGKTDMENKGLRQFKLGWATKEFPVYYSYYPEVPAGETLNSINKKIVEPIIKTAPQFVCQILGELFYKYMA